MVPMVAIGLIHVAYARVSVKELQIEEDMAPFVRVDDHGLEKLGEIHFMLKDPGGDSDVKRLARELGGTLQDVPENKGLIGRKLPGSFDEGP